MDTVSVAYAPETDEVLLARIGVAQVEKRDRERQRRAFRTAFAFMLPAIIPVVSLLLYPVAFDIYLSFTNWRKFKGFDQFIGLANYSDLVQNGYFSDAAINTLIWVVASLVLPVALGLALAIAFNGIRAEGMFKTIIFLPRILAPTAVGVIWYWVYAPQGVLNSILSAVTGQHIETGWLYQSSTITPSIIVTHTWQTVGLVMVLMLLGLAAVPRDPVEAAQMDGAKPHQVFWHIVLPLLVPTLLVVAIISVLAGFTAFDLLWVMGASYPEQRTLSLVVYMYFEAFQKGSWSYGGAIAVVIGFTVLAVTWVQAILQARAEKLTR